VQQKGKNEDYKSGGGQTKNQDTRLKKSVEAAEKRNPKSYSGSRSQWGGEIFIPTLNKTNEGYF